MDEILHGSQELRLKLKFIYESFILYIVFSERVIGPKSGVVLLGVLARFSRQEFVASKLARRLIRDFDPPGLDDPPRSNEEL